MAEAPQGQTGLSMIAENDYDLILMDLRRPGQDGLMAIRHIRAREDAKAKLPVIVVTADTGLTIARTASPPERTTSSRNPPPWI